MLAWERLSDGIHRCRLEFCDVSIGLVCGRTGTLVVDTGSTLAEAALIDAGIRGATHVPVTHVVLTHKHFDHVLGSSMFEGADIICTPEVVDCLTTGTDRLRADALSCGADAAEIDSAITALRPPRRGMYNAIADLGDRTVAITHPGRGHTTSDLIVVAPDRDGAGGPTVVFAGDLVEESGDPCIDADSDLRAWPSTLDNLLAIGGPEAIYVPGHGKVVDADFVSRQGERLRQRMAAPPQRRPRV